MPGEFLATGTQVAREAGYDSAVMTQRWSVIVSEESLSERLAPVPNFPSDPPESEIANWADRGFTVVRRAEREAEWLQEHSLAPRKQLPIKNLARDIEPHLVQLETFGIRQTRSYNLPDSTAADRRSAESALWAVWRRTNNSICMAHDVLPGESPGIDLHFSYGLVRTGDADVIAMRVQMWLDSEVSTNLIASLEGVQAEVRHAALWLSAEGETESAREQGTDFCPTRPMRLPTPIDVLWIFIGPIVLRFDGSWTSSALIPDEGASA